VLNAHPMERLTRMELIFAWAEMLERYRVWGV
jgi:hypothetical protein